MTNETTLAESSSRWYNFIPKLPYRDDPVFSIIFLTTLFLPLVFVPLLKEGYETPKFVFFLLASGLVLTLFALQNQVLSKKIANKYFLFGLAAFYVLTLLSFVFSLDWRNTLYGATGRNSNSILFSVGLGLYLLIILYQLNQERLFFLLKILVTGGALIGLYGLLQHQGILFYEGSINTRQFIPSFLGNPNFTSMYLSLVIPTGVYLLAEANKWFKLWYGLAVIVMIAAVAQSTSRAAILAMGVSLAITLGYALAWKTNRKFLLWAALALVTAITLSYASLNILRPGSIDESVQFQDTTQQYRLVAWDLTIEMIKQRPWLGTGFANYYIGFKEFGWSPFAAGERFDDPHNIFLSLAVNAGLPVAGLFTIFLAWILYLSLYKHKSEPLNIFLGAGIIAWIVAAMFGPVTVANWLALIILISGILYSHIFVTANWLLPKPLRYSTMGLGGMFIVFGLIFLYSSVLTQLAYENYNDGNYEKSLRYAELNRFGNLTNSESSAFLLHSRIQLDKPADETDAIITFLLRTRENSSTAHLNAAKIYFLLWRQTSDQLYLTKMEEAMNNSVRLERNHFGIYSQIAYLWFKAGDTEKALMNQRNALALNPNQFYGWALLARLYYDMGQREQMLFAYERLYKADTSSLLLKYTLQHYRSIEDIKTIPFPVHFPEPDL